MAKSMDEFWSKVGKVMVEGTSICGTGYFQIISGGREYRSVGPDEYGRHIWVCWEPWEVVSHFSCLKDPDATIQWVSTSG